MRRWISKLPHILWGAAAARCKHDSTDNFSLKRGLCHDRPGHWNWPLTGRSQAREATGNPAVATAKKDVSRKKKITTTRGGGRGESEGRFPSLSLALFSSLVFFSLSSSTSFPGFSPTRPAERERERALSLSLRRASRREPWEPGFLFLRAALLYPNAWNRPCGSPSQLSDFC